MSGSDYTRTLNLGLYKPVYNADAEQWGTHLNSNADTLDGLFSPTPGSSPFLLTTGGTMSGTLTLHGPPVGSNDAATKAYVDSSTVSGMLPLSGGTMTGPLVITATGANTARSLQDRWHDRYNLRDFGPAMDGVTSDQTPLTNAFAATSALGTIYVPPGNINFGAFAPTSKSVLWKLGGTFTGSGTTPIAAIGNNVFETMLGWTKWIARGSSQNITGLGGVLRLDMVLNHAGGTTGGVMALDVNASTTAGSTLSEAPMAISGRMTMNSTKVGAQVGVGVFGSGVKSSGAGNASPFGGNFIADDQTGLASSYGGSSVGSEIDLKANKLDDGTLADGFNTGGAGPYPGSQRAVATMQFGRSNRSDNTPMEVSNVLAIGLFSVTVDGAYCSAKNAINIHCPISFAGLNFLHSTLGASAQAIALQNEQRISWTSDALTVTPTNWRSLVYTTSGTSRLRYMVGATEVWSVTDAGQIIYGVLPTNAANDAAAASAGVPVGGVYRNGSALMVRTV